MNVPEEDRFERDPAHARRATGSVLVEYSGARPPIDEASVKSLMAGGISGLSVSDVSAIFIERQHQPAKPESHIGHLGPLAVARDSLRPLQAILGGLLLVVLALVVAVTALLRRLRRLSAALATEEVGADPRRPARLR